jgi:hypothetical protein
MAGTQHERNEHKIVVQNHIKNVEDNFKKSACKKKSARM